MVNEREFEGKDLEEALHTAAEALGIDEPDLDYKIIEQGRRGLFGVGAKSVRIAVMPPLAAPPDPLAAAELLGSVDQGQRKRRDSNRGPRREGKRERKPDQKREGKRERKPDPKREGTRERKSDPKRESRRGPKRERRREPRRESRPRPRPKTTATGEPLPLAPHSAEVEGTLQQMLGMMGMDVQALAVGSDNGVAIELDGKDRKLLTQKDGELINALQFLINRMARRAWPEAGRIHLSCDGHRKERDDDLVELTREVAHQVKRTGKSKRLHPMNAYERRLVHLTVREFDQLGSRSEGNGHLKRVKIYRQAVKAEVETEPEAEAEPEVKAEV
jgi:spoIIIJ-associated protein